MNTKERAFNLIAKTQEYLAEKQELSSQKVELGLIDKLESKYKSLGKSDVGNFIQATQRIVGDMKSAIDAIGNLLDEVKKAENGYQSMGDSDNAKIASRLKNDIQNDFDELVFIYNKLKSI